MTIILQIYSNLSKDHKIRKKSLKVFCLLHILLVRSLFFKHHCFTAISITNGFNSSDPSALTTSKSVSLILLFFPPKYFHFYCKAFCRAVSHKNPVSSAVQMLDVGQPLQAGWATFLPNLILHFHLHLPFSMHTFFWTKLYLFLQLSIQALDVEKSITLWFSAEAY